MQSLRGVCRYRIHPTASTGGLAPRSHSCIEFPRQRPGATVRRVFPAPTDYGHSLGLRTYIVEDNATIRDNLIGTLEELAGIQVVGTAETESEGTLWLRACADQWSMVIVDLFLKQGSGLGVLAACKERAAHQRVVVLSNYATNDIRTRCIQLGADAVFDKSNEIDALVDYCLLQCKVQPGAGTLPAAGL